MLVNGINFLMIIKKKFLIIFAFDIFNISGNILNRSNLARMYRLEKESKYEK